MRMIVRTMTEAREVLRARGTKVAIQACHEGPLVYCEKKDFLREYGSAGEWFCDYDGASAHCLFEDGVLHVHAGTRVSTDEPEGGA